MILIGNIRNIRNIRKIFILYKKSIYLCKNASLLHLIDHIYLEDLYNDAIL